jgi:hypothetical protein
MSKIKTTDWLADLQGWIAYFKSGDSDVSHVTCWQDYIAMIVYEYLEDIPEVSLVLLLCEAERLELYEDCVLLRDEIQFRKIRLLKNL